MQSKNDTIDQKIGNLVINEQTYSVQKVQQYMSLQS